MANRKPVSLPYVLTGLHDHHGHVRHPRFYLCHGSNLLMLTPSVRDPCPEPLTHVPPSVTHTPEGGGGTDSLSWGTDLETTAPPPLFGHGQPLVLPSSNLQPPLFIKANDSPLKLSLIAEFHCLFDLILPIYLF